MNGFGLCLCVCIESDVWYFPVVLFSCTFLFPSSYPCFSKPLRFFFPSFLTLVPLPFSPIPPSSCPCLACKSKFILCSFSLHFRLQASRQLVSQPFLSQMFLAAVFSMTLIGVVVVVVAFPLLVVSMFFFSFSFKIVNQSIQQWAGKVGKIVDGQTN